MPHRPCSVFKAKQCDSILFFSFLFFNVRHIGLLCMGVRNLFKGVNDTRKGFASEEGVMCCFLTYH